MNHLGVTMRHFNLPTSVYNKVAGDMHVQFISVGAGQLTRFAQLIMFPHLASLCLAPIGDEKLEKPSTAYRLHTCIT